MEHKQSPSNKNFISIHEEKLIREVDYDFLCGGSACFPKKRLLDLEILTKSPTQRHASQKVLVSIKSVAPSIKTLYIAEKNRYHAKKGSDKSGSHLAIGDHSSFTTHFSENDSNIVTSIASGTVQQTQSEIEKGRISSVTVQLASSAFDSECSQVNGSPRDVNVYNAKQRSAEKCYIYAQPQINMNLPLLDINTNKRATLKKADIGTLIITNTSSEDTTVPSLSTIKKLSKRIDHLERKILRQEMVFRSIDPNVPLSSSDESKENVMRNTSRTARPGCSYVEQYSHIPETSAFQRYAQQAAPLSSSKATTLEKAHNSEQYGRDFTTYDGLTARGRRQCASVPCKRDDAPKMAAERVHKIRHKLNPVRDYRLMDTVHYLAQGEFAPRDDGIKLTPSREAVLSDIIWEDVCRTHWPNTRLGRRARPERCSERRTTRCELQRLIDSLLTERVAHVERRRRRHYRIVKLNHRHESCRPLGKTGDIIVASHKHRKVSEDVITADHKAGSTMMAGRPREEQSPRKSHRSHDRLVETNIRQNHRSREDDGCPGPSYANRSPTCCYHTSNLARPESSSGAKQPLRCNQELTSGSSASACKPKNPRLVIKKESSRRKHISREEPNLEHYILLPTLVVRTPSNMKRQKKFNELYHRILNNTQNSPVYSEVTERSHEPNPNKKDMGFNINITLSNSSDQMIQK